MKHRNVRRICGLIVVGVLPLMYPTKSSGDDFRLPAEQNLLIKKMLIDITGGVPQGENSPAPDVDQVALAITRSAEDLRLGITSLESVRRYQDALKQKISSITPNQSINSVGISVLVETSRSIQTKLRIVEKLYATTYKRLADTSALPSLRGSCIAADLKQIISSLDDALTLIRSMMGENHNISRIAENNTLSMEMQRSIGLDLGKMITATQKSIKLSRDIRGPSGEWVKTIYLRDIEKSKSALLADYVCGGKWGTKAGDADDNYIEGTNGPDVILGRGGNDTIIGDTGASDNTGSDDIICGNAGNDLIYGAGGSDLIYGGSGNDTILGEYAGNILYGGDGDDNLQVATVFYGGNGNDTMFAGEWEVSRYFNGGDGNDDINGGSGIDYILGGNGSDRISGGGGNDVIFAGPSNGTVIGSYPQTVFPDGTVCGEANWDFIWGGEGNDYIYGDGGNDYIVAGPGTDVVYGGYSGTSEDAVTNPDGRDCVWGEEGNDTVHGGDGHDYIDGGKGNDNLYGDADIDFITGMEHADKIYGGQGNDKLYGDGWCTEVVESGDDQLFGGEGDDFLNGGGLSDTCDGEAGNDSSDGTCETVTSIP